MTSRITAAALNLNLSKRCRRHSKKNQLLVMLELMGTEQSDRECQFEASDYISKGKVKVMTETFPLNDIADVYERVNNENVRFGAVVTMNYL